MGLMKTKDGSFTPSLLLAAILLIVAVGVISFLKDPTVSSPSADLEIPVLETDDPVK
jgi:hypothetical protein